ncbi:MAG: YbhB/YbcL family Raf kinase inhibitor-like protein [Candidatus Omnitrophica bacterium]|nr:YbhB/YbcL family Raf kinase inhibitor-like protein [Candidatus Omnitrophota bacterium]
MPLTLTSEAFAEGAPIPSACTCDGKNASPALAWTEPPPGTRSFALIADDPDAPGNTWVHWVVYNIPIAARELPDGLQKTAERPDGTRQGLNDFGKVGYGGPCPPSGTHRYYFKLYALDTELNFTTTVTKAKLEQAMRGHILGQAQLMGTYQRQAQ